MRKPLKCGLGLHKWATFETEDGNRFKACVRCRKEGDEYSLIAGFAAGG